MKKTTIKEKISYCFDNLMAKGMPAQAGMLFFVTVIVTIIFGSLIYFVYPQLISSVYFGIWTTFMHMIDGGTITGDDGGFLYMLFMLTVTIIGLIVTATLISIINESLSRKMEKLRKGNSRILEKDHTIILGFNQGIYTIIENIMIANENEKKGGAIVIMDEITSKADMEDSIAEWIFHKKKEEREKHKYKASKYKTKIICRNGDIASKKAVSMCSPRKAKSIIVNCADDFMTVKAILAAAGNLDAEAKAHIVADVKDADYKYTAVLAGKVEGDKELKGTDSGRIFVVYVDEFVSRVISHTGRQPGISKVLTEFFGFDGSEIYIEPVPEKLKPKKDKEYTVYEANLKIPNAVIIGLKRNYENNEYKLMLNPAPNEKITLKDELIVLEEDNGEYIKEINAAEVECDVKTETAPVEEKTRKNTVIFGYSSKIPIIIEESKKYISDDSTFTVVLDDDDKITNEGMYAKDKKKARVIEAIKKLGENVKLVYLDLYKGEDYKKYLSTENGVDSVLILSDYSIDPEVNDANMLGLLLRVRDFKLNSKNKAEYSITTEMVKSENKELAIVKESKDFIVSEDITNKILSQISEQSERYAVFEEILQQKNSEIYIHSFSEYDLGLSEGEEFEYMEAFKKAAGKRQTLIGYQDKYGECFINPAKNKKIRFCKENSFIVIEQGENHE